jgi:tetratricopeptide (TPR) repeat protein
MKGDKKDQMRPEFEKTRVDLGDDLLEHTAVISRSVEKSDLNTSEGVADLLQSAKILTGEGLLEDAKKVLHRILMAYPTDGVARQKLNEIHELELKQIFGDGEIKRRPFGKGADLGLSDQDSESLMRELDRDLQLGVFSNSGSWGDSNPMSLFQDPELMSSFCSQLELDLSQAEAQDWIDLGIAFLEMDLYEIAVRLFSGAFRRSEYSPGEQNRTFLSASCLLAMALILTGRPFEAVAKVQPLLGDVNISQEQKAELFYLMGRVYESMQKFGLALQFYKQVMEIDARYRDIDLRIRQVHG